MSSADTFRTIGELAEACGHFCWVETELFEVTGRWASGDGPAEWRLFSSITAAQHADLASRWRSRLPVRVGVDQATLIRPPEAQVSALTALGGHPIDAGLPVLLQEILPELISQYRSLLNGAAPVREAPVMALLTSAMGVHEGTIERGKKLLQ